MHLSAFTLLLTTSITALYLVAADNYPIKAVAVLSGKGSTHGVVILTQQSADSSVLIAYKLTGNDPNETHGFHIHQLGDLSKGCDLAGPHYNPFNKTHGAPTDVERHVGDLGNIQSDATGAVNGNITDSLVKLTGPNSVIGRAFVLHAGVDDLGKGTSADSKKTGNAGGRNACGVIGIA